MELNDKFMDIFQDPSNVLNPAVNNYLELSKENIMGNMMLPHALLERSS